jgi:hypothetical protein
MRNSQGKRNNNNKATAQDRHDIVDIATDINEAKAANNKFICKECASEEILLRYREAEIENPHAGPSYICPVCTRIYDSSLEKLPKASRRVTSSIGSPANVTPFIETINENAGEGLLNRRKDEYSEINDRFEPNEDEQIRAMGATIIDSKITLTDRQGTNRTIVKRDFRPVTTLD